MLDREQLETFATIVEQGSFERAATVLNVTRGAVSQRIKALEESLATVLLLRDKPTRATERGEVLMRYVKAMRLLEGTTLSEVMPQGHRQAPVPVAIAVNADSLVSWFAPIVSALMGTRRVALEIISDDQDHTFQRLARGQVIGCVSTEPQPIQGFVAEELGCMEYRCMASPCFASEHFPQGLTLPALLSAPAVLFDRKDGLHDSFLQGLFGFAVERYARHYIPLPMTLLDSIVQGGGYGLVPAKQGARYIESGQLLELAPQHPVHVALYWHHWRSEQPLAQQITKLVTETAQQQLLRPPAPLVRTPDLSRRA
jgi:LysR family transcriptional regulator, chromosome initiation inhibitor